MKVQKQISIAKDFFDAPGGREITDGDNSGQLVYPKLEEAFESALKNKYKIEIDLDGLFGLPSSFVSATFGELSKKFGADIVLKHIELKCERRRSRVAKVEHVIQFPNQKFDS